ncbi:MAG: GspE/PulE family protein [Xanthomonadaceae bacterium]|nr:GspE/PulE family protein [Xanthomonadaceae bacterium]
MATAADHKLTLPEVLEWLEADGILAAAQAKMLRQLAQGGAFAGKHPLEVVVGRGWTDAREPARPLTLEALSRWLAARVDLPYYTIDPLKVDVARTTSVMPYAYAARYGALPVEVGKTEITVATSEPFVRAWESELEHVQKKKFRRVFMNPVDLQRYQVEFYSISKSVFGAGRDQGASPSGRMQSLEQLLELGRSGQLDANDQHVVSIVDWLLQYAFDQRASDIHLEPRREHANMRFRIDGVMQNVYELPAAVYAPVLSRLKILGRMDIAEKRRPQDGRLKTRTPAGDEVELRLSTMPTAFGEKLVMRIFDPVVLLKNFRELGFDNEDEAAWRELVEHPHGIVLVTGPTGSGKTTTLYSTLRQIARPEVNVCTVEDPIELVEPAFNQMQVHAGIGLDFASGVRTLLRQDPDVIMIGEIRDSETANMAVQAALTGHLVLSTLHTNDAPSAVTRLLELGVPAYLIQSTVRGVIAQRLVRTLCPHCKVPADTDAVAWEALVAPFKAPVPPKVQAPVGCLECRNTGFLGRVGLYEMMAMTPPLRETVLSGTDAGALRRAAWKDGLKPLRIRGAHKVAEGVTTIAEVLRAAPPGED